MAGAGYRLFATGDVLTAAQVNTYLQQQTVMVFADSSARTTALSGVIAEGMVSYLQSDDTVYVYNGSAWVSIANSGDITSVVAGNGLSGGATSGAATLTIDTAITVDKTTSQTLTNKTLTNPLINPTISTQGSAYTLVAADQGTLIQMSATSSVALTLPPSVFAAGAQIDVIATGVAGTITFTQGSGVTILSTGATSTAPKLRVIYSAATIICKTGGASPVFYVVGDIS
jgi:hypothetical protein